MDSITARSSLNAQLVSLAERRARAQKEVDRTAWEIGATATYLRDVLRQPKVRSAEFAGLSPSHLTEWMRTAVEQNIQIDDPLKRLAFLQGADLQTYVDRHGGPRRIVASFAEADAMYMAGLDPESLIDARYGNGLRLPHMLICTRSGEWVAVDNVMVGYGGTGPRNALRELTGLGLDPRLIHDIVDTRVTDIDLDDPTAALSTNVWPHVDLDKPTPVGDYFVVVVPVDDPGAEHAREGDDAFDAGETPIDRWLTWLDDAAAPPWLQGTRRARVYVDRELARCSGFCAGTLTPWWRSVGEYPVIIEQGRLQLWLDVATSNDSSVLFTPETYAALDQAGFFTEEFRERDEQSSFWRWLRSFGAQRPAFVDLDGVPLRYHPSTG